MTILSKILCGFLILAAIPFFYLSARALKTHETWRSYYDRFDNAVQAENQRQENLRFGEFNENGERLKRGIKQAQLRLTQLLAQRGRVWSRCTPGDPNEQGEVNVIIGQPGLGSDLQQKPHQIRIDEGTLLVHVFEERTVADGGKYIGSFEVKAVSPDQNLVTLTPALALTPNLQTVNPARAQANADFLQKLRGSVQTEGMSWVMYDVMPVDNHDAFQELREVPDELDALLPQETVDEYKQEGRRLRDYAVLFREYDKLYSTLRIELDGYNTDNAAVAHTLADTMIDVQFCMQQIGEAQAELERMNFERDSAIQYQTDVGARVMALNEMVEKSFSSIKQVSDELDALQKATVKKAEERAARTTAQAN